MCASKPTGDWAPVMTTVLLMADNQTQHLYGDPFWMRSAPAPWIVRAAVRPLQLDLYGQDLLKWVIDQNDKMIVPNDGRKVHDDRIKTAGFPIIHLGDGLNFSCKVEMTTFFENMGAIRTPWAMAPGNHDGYFFGIYGESTDWAAACDRGEGPADRSAFISRYLDALRSKYGVAALSGATGRWQRQVAVSGSDGFLDGVAWAIYPAAPWRSYVTQILNVSQPGGKVPVFVVLLDTSQFVDAPALNKIDAGSLGSILDDQVEAARQLVAARTPRGAPPLVVLMGHHPYGTLMADARKRFDSLMSDVSAVTYVSAHTHSAQYFVNPGRDSGPAWLELNLGSVLDWSPEYREFSLDLDSSGKRVEIDTRQHKLFNAWDTNGPLGHPDWEAKPNEQRFYVTFLDVGRTCSGVGDLLCSKQMQLQLMHTELAEIQHSISLFPTTSSAFWPTGTTDDQQVQDAISKNIGDSDINHVAQVTAFAQELQTFDETRIAASPAGSTAPDHNLHHDYRLWQALWASREMQTRARLPDASQQYFVLPRGN